MWLTSYFDMLVAAIQLNDDCCHLHNTETVERWKNAGSKRMFEEQYSVDLANCASYTSGKAAAWFMVSNKLKKMLSIWFVVN